jgi:ABC-type methionine transport system ATPase subunit
MVMQILRLVYPPTLVNRPILQDLIRNFEIKVIIRRAQITLEEGWLEARVEGAPEEIERAISWLEGEGVDVERLEEG